jgi:hypothetical protein
MLISLNDICIKYSTRFLTQVYQLNYILATWAFLDAVESDLESPSPAIFTLFNEGNNFLFSSHPHTGLLCALEALAWASEHLPDAAGILAELARRAPKAAIHNSPMNSLREIFLPWHPQTSAPVERRIKVLDTLLKRYPETAWNLLLELLPGIHTATDLTNPPAFLAGLGRGALPGCHLC